MPLEYYPPVINFLNCAVSKNHLNICVYSTKNNKNRKEYSNNRLDDITRFPLPKENDKLLKRIFKYLKFNIFSFIGLIVNNPEEILYFESYSASPVFWYLRFFGKNKKLKIHYHEYSSPDWYNNGMFLVKIYHQYEKKFLYKKADWISQTNSKRVELFLKDNPKVKKEKLQVLPNYPPKSWSKNKNVLRTESHSIKTVYVGSLSLKDTYIKEYCEWVISQNGKITFDIYCFNIHYDTQIYLENLSSNSIRFFNNGLEYDDLPKTLNKYDVGVILYKAQSPNYRFNAPNKLFEYIACGLEIWFSDKMEGCYPYIQHNDPRIIPVKFLDIHDSELLKVKTHFSSSSNHKFIAEEALKPLIGNLKK